MNLNTGAYQPYRKKNNTIHYVDSKSNHPPAIIKNVPKSINTRISVNSIDEQTFNYAKKEYEEALKISGYKYEMKFDKSVKTPETYLYSVDVEKEKDTENTPSNKSTQNTQDKRPRKRNITWYNPPYSANVATNIGKTFLALIDKCFPKGHTLNKILNRNTIKLSYSCLPNVERAIQNHNNKLLSLHQDQENAQRKLCNCRDKNACPLNGECLRECVVYQATVTETDTQEENTYIGLTENSFKTRYNLHKSSFKLAHKRSATSLSEHIWKMKENNANYKIEWEILSQCKRRQPYMNYCPLCVEEKHLIGKLRPNLNQHSQFFYHCLHQRQKTLEKFKPTISIDNFAPTIPEENNRELTLPEDNNNDLGQASLAAQ